MYLKMLPQPPLWLVIDTQLDPKLWYGCVCTKMLFVCIHCIQGGCVQPIVIVCTDLSMESPWFIYLSVILFIICSIFLINTPPHKWCSASLFSFTCTYTPASHILSMSSVEDLRRQFSLLPIPTLILWCLSPGLVSTVLRNLLYCNTHS